MNGNSFSPRLIALFSGLFLCILILLSVRERPAVPAAAMHPSPAPPAGLSAEAYVVRLVGAGDAPPLLTQRSQKRMAPASLTKIMTVFIAREVLSSDETVVFSADAKAVEDRRSDAAAGEAFSRDDAARMALMESANDAALALAEAVGAKAGKTGFGERIAFFVRLMNERAAGLAMADTHFENPMGLDAPVHLMSAADLARLVEHIMASDPALFAMTRDTSAVVFSREQKKHTIISTNELFKEFPALAGGKTGFTDNAKGALLLLYPVRNNPDFSRDANLPRVDRISNGVYPVREAASRHIGTPQKKIAVIVILKSDDRFGDGRKIIQFLEHNFP